MKRRAASFTVGLLSVVTCATAPVRGQEVIHVNEAAAGPGDGTSWADAYTDLHAALLAATTGDEIWVAVGTYDPAETTGDPAAAYQLKSGVAVYGGFAGSETAREQRSPALNPTVLGGDGTVSSHIVTGNNTDATAVLDGFTITGAVAGDDAIGGVGGAGGGMLIVNGSPTIEACTITGNKARLGSGVMIVDGSPTFTDCDISANLSARSGEGGAIYAMVNNGMPPQQLNVTGCTFQSNSVMQGHFATGHGGAIYCGPDVTLTVSDSTFQSNFTFHNQSFGNATTGGAICNHGDNATISHSIFLTNYSSLGAGVYSTTPITLTNCMFMGNRAVAVGCVGPECGNATDPFSGHGGGIYGSNVTLWNCTLAANWAAKNGAGASMNGTVDNSILWGNLTYPVCCGEDPVPLVRQQIDGNNDILYSCVEGLLTPEPGEDPINPDDFPGSTEADPLFVVSPVVSNLGHLTTVGDVRVQTGSPCVDAGDNDTVPAGVTADLDGNDRFADDPNTPDTGNPGTPGPPVVDMGAYETQAPVLISVCPSLGNDAQPNSYIHPASRHVGLDTVEILLSADASFVSACATSTGGSAPSVTGLTSLGDGVHEVQFDGPIEVGEWTTVTLTVESTTGIQGTVCFQLGHLPGDCNQDGQVGLADATQFGSEFNGPQRLKLADLNSDGQVNLADGTKFGQIWTGTSAEEDPRDGLGWNGKGLDPRPPCTCP